MMLRVLYKASFIRQYAKFPLLLQQEVKEKIALFQKNPRDPSLRVHKLKGALQECFSFSVNYRYRIVFVFLDKKTVRLLSVGDHTVYD